MDILNFISICDDIFEAYDNKTHHTKLNIYESYAAARSNICDTKEIIAVIEFLSLKLTVIQHQTNVKRLKYFQVLESISLVATKQEPENEFQPRKDTNWIELINVIIERREVFTPFSDDSLPSHKNRYDAFAKSYLNLKNLGVEFLEADYKISILDSSHAHINKLIDEACRKLGGNNLLTALAARIGNSYNPTTGRFMEYRHISLETTTAAIPFGYLMAIASKYAETSENGDNHYFKRLESLLSDLIVIFEIQPYNEFEAFCGGIENIANFIRNNILYDTYVSLPQTNASHSKALLNFIQRHPELQSCTSHNIKLKDLTRTAVALIALSKTKKFTSISAKELSSKARISEYRVAAVMDKLLSTESGTVNTELKFPPNATKINHDFKPAIKIKNAYIVFPKSIAAFGCLTSTCWFIGHPNDVFSNPADGKLGYAVEDYLRYLFAKNGIEIAHGKYRLNKHAELEADLICETNNCIYIFEIKKKGLTRESRSGDDRKILYDLAESLLYSQLQAMRIERELRINDSTSWTHNGIEKRVSLKGRNILRISVSLFDFGALQDKLITQRILSFATDANVKMLDNSSDKHLDKWRKYSDSLKEITNTTSNNVENVDFRFHNSLYMSIPQIIMFLENAKNIDDFFGQIRKFVYMNSGCRCPYTEYLNRLKLYNKANEQLK
ncbi:MAG TPA: hypothetical protein VIZ65_12025 [Cellvibrionaceae bacterium]